MVNRFVSPRLIAFVSPVTGAPLTGGKLAFFISGTSTPLNTYKDQALSVLNTNPVTLDSNGMSGDVFLQNLAYKVVLSDASDVVQWSADPVYSSDFSALAQLSGNNGNPNGVVAGTAASAGVAASVVFDFTNKILYVCTTTGNAATAVWTAINPSTTSSTPSPQGYLTIDPANILPIVDTVGTSISYVPFVGNSIPIWNGSVFAPLQFPALSFALTGSQGANNLYDAYVYLKAGVPFLSLSPAWFSATPGAGIRGAAVDLNRLSGFLVNKTSMTTASGDVVGPNFGTYVGTIWIDGTAGQVSCHRSYAQNRKWGVWNQYNRQNVSLKSGESLASWTYSTNTMRATNNVPTSYIANNFNVGSGFFVNGLTTLVGNMEDMVEVTFLQNALFQTASGIPGSGGGATVGIGINSTTAATGFKGGHGDVVTITVAATSADIRGPQLLCARAVLLGGSPLGAPGLNNFASLEQGSGSATETFFGTEANCVMTASWRA